MANNQKKKKKKTTKKSSKNTNNKLNNKLNNNLDNKIIILDANKKKETTNNKKKSNKSTIQKTKSSTNKKSTQKNTKKLKEITKKKINKKETIKEIEIDYTKNNKKYLLFLGGIFVLILLYFGYKYLYIAPTPLIKDVYLENNIVVIKFENNYSFRDKKYCLFKEDDKYPLANDNWILANNNICKYELDDKIYYTFIKNEDNQIYRVTSTNKLGTITNININKEKIYLPVNGSYEFKITYDKKGYVEDNIIWTSENDKIAIVKDGKVKAISKGTTYVSAKILDKEIKAEIVVTNLITERPSKGFDYKKKNLGCNKYSKEENDLLDNILKDRINEVGYKTRAGAVEAARFLTLDFPYRINYFYENGRQTTNNVDGEGRYYHVGLYLNKSRYSKITGSKKGPKTWGCSLYSVPAHRKIVNGLDCSGFVSWALLNAGFDVKDVGAGWSDNRDLTDYGTVKRLTKKIATGNTIKVGDILHSERAGGHIGIIIGIDKNNYYVAQALWYGQIGVIITKINKSKLPNHFPHVVLMDKYYKKDGKLTNMW